MKLTKELINSEVEKLRQELIAKLEQPKFELNRWYKDTKSDLIIFIKSFDNKAISAYGFNIRKDWIELSGDFYGGNMDNAFKDLRLATQSEVQAALEAEAVNRGFKEGVKIKVVNTSMELTLGYSAFNMYDNCCYLGGVLIFRDGKWSQIIPQEKTSEEWVKQYDGNQIWLTSFLESNNLKITKK